MTSKSSVEPVLHIDPLKRGRITVKLIGTTPFYFNAMSAKAKRTLLIGGGKKTAAERRELKHDPEQEFRDSVGVQFANGPTALGFPAPGVKRAMAEAALETPGAKKTVVNRLVFMPEPRIRIWGRPLLKMDVVRSADMNRTPDIRTRAWLPRWGAEIDIAFVTPALSVHSIISLLANAGIIVGIGDFRQGKGKGSFGTFAVAGDELGEWAEAWQAIAAEGRIVQLAALAKPEAADEETRDLLAILQAERARRAA